MDDLPQAQASPKALPPSRPLKNPSRTPRSALISSLPALPPLTPFVSTVSARVLKEAEKQLEALRAEVEELKRKDKERESSGRAGPVIQELEDGDDDDESLATAREILEKEMELQYLIARENLQKRLQQAFFNKREELERQRRSRFSGPEIAVWKGDAKKGTADEVLVVTMGRIPGFQLVQSGGPIQAIIPRSRHLNKLADTPFLHDFDDDNDTTDTHTLQIANIIRLAAFDGIAKAAHKRGANAVINFEYKSRYKAGSDKEVVEIMARGTACVLKRVSLQQQQRSDQQAASKTQILDALQGLARRQGPSREQQMASELTKMMQQQMMRGRSYQNQNRGGNGYQPWEDSTTSLLRSLMGDKPVRTPRVRFADQSGGWGGGDSDSSGGNSNDWSALDLSLGPNPPQRKSHSIEDSLIAALTGKAAPSPFSGLFGWESQLNDSTTEGKKEPEREPEFTWS